MVATITLAISLITSMILVIIIDQIISGQNWSAGFTNTIAQYIVPFFLIAIIVVAGNLWRLV